MWSAPTLAIVPAPARSCFATSSAGSGRWRLGLFPSIWVRPPSHICAFRHTGPVKPGLHGDVHPSRPVTKAGGGALLACRGDRLRHVGYRTQARVNERAASVMRCRHKRTLILRTLTLFFIPILCGAAFAQPLPIARDSSQACPTGYVGNSAFGSPVSDRLRAVIPKSRGGACPVGWNPSGSACLKL